MEMFDERKRCPKCGGGFVLTKYDPQRDQIGRKCERCGHTWRERPLTPNDMEGA